ncbi:hypothetical protein [Cohnella nanjingensis]|uniref:Uncharacterized protein n=1 Tax=Cohnella nanjingensis TaxID=1387779 RepID=A0A7X0VFZ4_9BACL|nr:hypothetical protein [Cohnella nanjingensis]MBB6672595.1 hypothetical protein [Cohnella nanjingensis]
MHQLKPGLTHEDIFKRFTESFHQIAKNILDDVVGEYLPHAESDLDSNVYYRAMDYIAGTFGADSMYGSAGKRFRQHIFEDNKDLIIDQLNQDIQAENEQLRNEVEAWKSAYYRSRHEQ